MPTEWVRVTGIYAPVAVIMDNDVKMESVAVTGKAMSQDALRQAMQDAGERLSRRLQAFSDWPATAAAGKIAIVVDEGIETGTTMLAMIAALRQQGAVRVVVATPVASAQAIARLTPHADEIVCLEVPRPFNGIAECYIHLPDLSDADTLEALAAASRKTA